MGEPSDDDVPTMTSSADLRGSSGGDEPADSGVDADDRTIQQGPGNLRAIENAMRARATGELPVTPPRPRPPAAATATASATIDTVVRAAGADTDAPPPSEEDVTSPKRRVPDAAKTHGVTSAAPATPPTPRIPQPADAASTEGEAAADDSTITATAPRGVSSLPLTPPKSVEIRTLGDADESGEETEVRKLDGDLGDTVRSALAAKRADPRPAAGRPASPTSEADVADDSVTAQSPSVPKPASRKSDPALRPITDRGGGASGGAAAPSSRGSSPGIRLPQKSLAPAKERSPAAAAAVAKAAAAATGAGAKSKGLPPAIEGAPPDDDESTTRGPARSPSASRADGHAADAADDSVTAQSPKALAGALPPPIDGETEGTTRRVRPPEGSPADGEPDSVTAHAPGHLTNMLRVIASPSSSDAPPDGEDENDGAHTQVMANAPVKPSELGAALRRGSGAMAAEQLEPTSESGLRVANPDHVSGERASLGALGVPPRERRLSSGPMRAPIGSEHAIQSQLAPNMAPRPQFAPAIPSAPSSHRGASTGSPFGQPTGPAEWERKPPYALIVGIVALISIAIPVILFFALNSSGGDQTEPLVGAQPAPDLVTRGDPARPRKPATNGSARDKRPGGHR